MPIVVQKYGGTSVGSDGADPRAWPIGSCTPVRRAAT